MESLGSHSDTLHALVEMLRALETFSSTRSSSPDIGSPDSSITSNTCRITFLGDSLMEDQRIALTCQLMELGYKISHAVGRAEGQTGNSHFNAEYLHSLLHSTNIKSTLQSTMLTLTLTVDRFAPEAALLQGACHKIELLKIPPLDVVTYPELREKYIKDGLALLDWEVHCNNQNCILETIQNLLQPIGNALRQHNTTLVLRSAEAQHFKTTDGSGLYEMKIPKSSPGCTRITNPDASRYRIRLIEEHFLSKFPYISVIPMYEWSFHKYFLHYPEDCTHYCYAPGRFEPVWKELTAILQGAKL